MLKLVVCKLTILLYRVRYSDHIIIHSSYAVTQRMHKALCRYVRDVKNELTRVSNCSLYGGGMVSHHVWWRDHVRSVSLTRAARGRMG